MFYLWEIEEQCRYAMKAWKIIQMPDDVDTEPWYSIQAFLVATANISKLLETSSARGKELSTMLSIQDSHPIRSKKMRNSFEHFDERLDTWIASGKGHHYGRISGVSTLGKFRDDDNVRHYERDTGLLTFLGEEYNLKLIAGETEKLYKRSRELTGPPDSTP